MTQPIGQNRLIIVTGLSGAGKTTALKALEDSGFETIDNLPVDAIQSVAVSILPETNLAIGVDARTRGFSVRNLKAVLTNLQSNHSITPEVIFMEAADTVLVKRFSETRRRHPLSIDTPVEDGIAMEREITDGIRAFATHHLDTSLMSVTDARLFVKEKIGHNTGKLVVTIMSFGFSKGVPRGADLVFDVRFLKNPHYQAALKPLTGQQKQVQDFVKSDPAYTPFVEKILDLLTFLLPEYEKEGKSYLTVAFGCTGGRHRSVTLAEDFKNRLQIKNLDIHSWHRDS